MLEELMVSVVQVQVIQQPLQNPTYLQQLYNTQGQLLMPSNLQLHPAGMNPSSIHVSVAFPFLLHVHCVSDKVTLIYYFFNMANLYLSFWIHNFLNFKQKAFLSNDFILEM
jgi:hypothetical protein